MFINLATYKYKRERPTYYISDLYVESTGLHFEKQYLFMIDETLFVYCKNNKVRRKFRNKNLIVIKLLGCLNAINSFI